MGPDVPATLAGMTETGADLRVTDADHDELVGTGCLGRPVSYRKVQIAGADGRPVPPGQAGEIRLAGPVFDTAAGTWTDRQDGRGSG